jgi:nucleoside-diphosphate-sugar epimerase
MKKLIITGAEGNLGKHISEQAPFHCLPVGRSGWDRLVEVAPSDYQALIHCAYDLKTDINSSPAEVLDSNIQSTARALNLCRVKMIKKFVFISSCSVYGDSSNTSESKLCQPVTMNGRIKLFNEELIKSFCTANGIGYLILRVFNSYGGDDCFSVVKKLMVCARENRPFILVNGGLAERDFIHVSDVARYVCELLTLNVENDVINVGSGQSVRVIDLLRAVEQRYGPIAVTPVTRENEVIYSRANIHKLSRLLPLRSTDVVEFIQSLKS